MARRYQSYDPNFKPGELREKKKTESESGSEYTSSDTSSSHSSTTPSPERKDDDDDNWKHHTGLPAFADFDDIDQWKSPPKPRYIPQPSLLTHPLGNRSVREVCDEIARKEALEESKKRGESDGAVPSTSSAMDCQGDDLNLPSAKGRVLEVVRSIEAIAKRTSVDAGKVVKEPEVSSATVECSSNVLEPTECTEEEFSGNKDTKTEIVQDPELQETTVPIERSKSTVNEPEDSDRQITPIDNPTSPQDLTEPVTIEEMIDVQLPSHRSNGLLEQINMTLSQYPQAESFIELLVPPNPLVTFSGDLLRDPDTLEDVQSDFEDAEIPEVHSWTAPRGQPTPEPLGDVQLPDRVFVVHTPRRRFHSNNFVRQVRSLPSFRAPRAALCLRARTKAKRLLCMGETLEIDGDLLEDYTDEERVRVMRETLLLPKLRLFADYSHRSTPVRVGERHSICAIDELRLNVDDDIYVGNGVAEAPMPLNGWSPSVRSPVDPDDLVADREKYEEVMETLRSYKDTINAIKDHWDHESAYEQKYRLAKSRYRAELYEALDDELRYTDNTYDIAVHEVQITCGHSPAIETIRDAIWIKTGPKCHTDVSAHAQFCRKKRVEWVTKLREHTRDIRKKDYRRVRARANEYESLGSHIFLNRAAMKLANMDANLGFLFRSLDSDPRLATNPSEPIYFADICGGPGGFTEYLLFNKEWNYRGFGITLKCDIDWKLAPGKTCTYDSFEAIYGTSGNGDIRDADNIRDFCDRVRRHTRDGVHVALADGGISVDGFEHLQEQETQELILCECLIALKTLRENGHFLCKFFDTFLEFTLDLLFVLGCCFESMTFLKPFTSRPANSERYLVCKYRKADVKEAVDLLEHVAALMRKHRDDRVTVKSFLHFAYLEANDGFFRFMTHVNNTLCLRQIFGLLMLNRCADFPPNVQLPHEPQDVEELRRRCLSDWRLPLRYNRNDYDLFDDMQLNMSYMKVLLDIAQTASPFFRFTETALDPKGFPGCLENSVACFINSKGVFPHKFFYVTDSKIYVLDGDWSQVKYISNSLKLPPGSLVFGDIWSEMVNYPTEHGGQWIRVFNIIDAYQLGSFKIFNLNFMERRKQIVRFAKAIDKETADKDTLRIRAKSFYFKPHFQTKCLFVPSGDAFKHFCPDLNGFKTSVVVDKLMILKQTTGVKAAVKIVKLENVTKRNRDLIVNLI